MPERAIGARERRLVIERAGGRCEYCLSPVAYCPDPFAIVGLTPTGRATVTRLDLNRPYVVNLRRLLRDIGQHPPPHTVGPR